MQISRIYSNFPEIFAPIDFNHGDASRYLNVIYGEVRHPSDQKRDSHNLGKTTLLHVIDFLLLKGMWPEHFLLKNKDRFEQFIFYIEIALNDGDYATIRRAAANAGRIAMTRHSEGGQDFAGAADDFWDHPDISRDDGVRLLDGLAQSTASQAIRLSHGDNHFLRAQGDYSDELQLQKFQAGRDVHWKPFIAHLFGFDESPVVRKI